MASYCASIIEKETFSSSVQRGLTFESLNLGLDFGLDSIKLNQYTAYLNQKSFDS